MNGKPGIILYSVEYPNLRWYILEDFWPENPGIGWLVRLVREDGSIDHDYRGLIYDGQIGDWIFIQNSRATEIDGWFE